ncbi:MAG: phosphate ABC transporter substrate-binding protein [Thermodesulfovibrionales bacterium]|nr:phosphate ABC transporter substrate-binding protein [Thermodesulfovibrionales bacterium]
MKRLLALVIATTLFITVTLVSGVYANWNKPLTIKGSDTMVILNQRWAEHWMKKTPNKRVQVTGGGSGTGIAALINGTTDIAASSRPLKDLEIKKVQSRFQSTVMEIANSKDGIGVYISESNPVKELTLDQIKDIFTGKINNWKEVGGKDAKIIRYSRESNSGTYLFFKENVLKKLDYAADSQNMPGTAAVINAVSKDPNGIGYGGAAYASGVKMVFVKKDANTQGYQATEENVASGKYPISRNLYYYVPKKIYDKDVRMKEFIDFVCSKEGQDIVKAVGYFPIKQCQITERK